MNLETDFLLITFYLHFCLILSSYSNFHTIVKQCKNPLTRKSNKIIIANPTKITNSNEISSSFNGRKTSNYIESLNTDSSSEGNFEMTRKDKDFVQITSFNMVFLKDMDIQKYLDLLQNYYLPIKEEEKKIWDIRRILWIFKGSNIISRETNISSHFQNFNSEMEANDFFKVDLTNFNDLDLLIFFLNVIFILEIEDVITPADHKENLSKIKKNLEILKLSIEIYSLNTINYVKNKCKIEMENCENFIKKNTVFSITKIPELNISEKTNFFIRKILAICTLNNVFIEVIKGKNSLKRIFDSLIYIEYFKSYLPDQMTNIIKKCMKILHFELKDDLYDFNNTLFKILYEYMVELNLFKDFNIEEIKEIEMSTLSYKECSENIISSMLKYLISIYISEISKRFIAIEKLFLINGFERIEYYNFVSFFKENKKWSPMLIQELDKINTNIFTNRL